MDYFENMDKIEELWRKCREKDFKDKNLNDLLFQTCKCRKKIILGKSRSKLESGKSPIV